ncbi:hypothetical protein E2C01_092226 [Portunus trituberculatus]|uniref:Uncharacterized protein n=1 Tax=Portunus trituberculatus TaxID=210409 RepID=A0A5B7JX71_PORTR|nr:hypothetical protein [Portunus trituberculatus]
MLIKPRVDASGHQIPMQHNVFTCSNTIHSCHLIHPSIIHSTERCNTITTTTTNSSSSSITTATSSGNLNHDNNTLRYEHLALLVSHRSCMGNGTTHGGL